MNLKLINFGPINNGLIELFPLTIFTGNCYGKTFTSKLIYSIAYFTTNKINIINDSIYKFKHEIRGLVRKI